jgi:hypothetical protein
MDFLRGLRVAALLMLVAGLCGCAASGPKHEEIRDSIPAIAPGNGRIFFYRDSSAFGAAMRPEIRLNGEVVGRSAPGGFFYVDRAPGTYEIATATEVERILSFTLEAGETRYVRTSVSMGALVGRVTPELVDAEEAVGELAGLSYTGDPSQVSATSPPADSPVGPPAGPAQEPRRTDMNDLKDLLPPQK